MTTEAFRDAVAAIDAGDVGALERLLAAHPSLVHERGESPEAYFARPYLLWFVAENPVRNGRLPQNIGDVTRAILRAGANGREQMDYAVALVASGRVPRECGVQIELIDILVDSGADPRSALVPALAHREVAAVERLLEHGAPLTLQAAVCTGRRQEAARLLASSSAEDRQSALSAAALYGNAEMVSLLIAAGGDVSSYSPPDFHPHATALHHAIDSGSLDAVKALVEAGASLETKDRIYQGTPLDWAEYLERTDIAAYLRAR